MSSSTRRILVLIALAAAVFVLLAPSGLGLRFAEQGSTAPTRLAGWTWDDSAAFD